MLLIKGENNYGFLEIMSIHVKELLERQVLSARFLCDKHVKELHMPVSDREMVKYETFSDKCIYESSG